MVVGRDVVEENTHLAIRDTVLVVDGPASCRKRRGGVAVGGTTSIRYGTVIIILVFKRCGPWMAIELRSG